MDERCLDFDEPWMEMHQILDKLCSLTDVRSDAVSSLKRKRSAGPQPRHITRSSSITDVYSQQTSLFRQQTAGPAGVACVGAHVQEPMIGKLWLHFQPTGCGQMAVVSEEVFPSHLAEALAALKYLKVRTLNLLGLDGGAARNVRTDAQHAML